MAEPLGEGGAGFQLLGLTQAEDLPRLEAEGADVVLDDHEALHLQLEHAQLPSPQADELNAAHPAQELGQVVNAERDVPGLVTLVVAEQLPEYGLDLSFAYGLEDGECDGLDHQLHAHQLLGEVVGSGHLSQQLARGPVEGAGRPVELGEVGLHHVEVAGFVVGLRGGGEFCLEGLELQRQVTGYPPCGELSPEDDREQPGEGVALFVGEVHSAVFFEQAIEHFAAVPDLVLTLVVDASEFVRGVELLGTPFDVEHVVGDAVGGLWQVGWAFAVSAKNGGKHGLTSAAPGCGASRTGCHIGVGFFHDLARPLASRPDIL